MMNFLKDFYYEEEGMGTVEIVIIIAVLIAIALVFKEGIGKFVNDLMNKFFDTNNVETNDIERTTV